MSETFSTNTDLSRRPAGYSVVLECVARQEQAVPRSKLKRILGFRPLHPGAQAWYTGAVGEIHVGQLLEQLGPEWTVLHAVPVGTRGSDIDHVIIGPPGVFTLNTKHHAGAKVWVSPRSLLVNGQKTDHLRNSRYEAKRTAKALTTATGTPVDAHPLLVVVGAASITIRQKPDDVTVLSSNGLVRWLNRRGSAVDSELGQRIKDAALKEATWTTTVGTPVDEKHMVTFAALRRESDQARVRRIAWMLLGTLVLVVTASQSIPGWIAAIQGS